MQGCSQAQLCMWRVSNANANACACLQVCGERIKAHKLILTTQCDYFRKMLAPDQFAEGSTNTVKVRCVAG